MSNKSRCGVVRFAVPAAAAACVAAGLWLLLGGTGAAPGRAVVAPSKSVEPSVAPLRASAPSVELSFSSPQKQTVTKAIEQIHIFDRVLGTNPQLTDAERNIPEPDPATWRVLSLRMAKASGKVLDIKLARSLVWIEQVGAKVGGFLDMDLPEMGAVGVADVLAIEACPPLKPGQGNVVTGTFAHEADHNLITLRLSNDIDPIGVTDNHPFWSEERLDFVPSGELRAGEHVRTRSGVAEIVGTVKRPLMPGERVYNLEVHGEHVYEITAAGILVHNQYHVYAILNKVTGLYLKIGVSRGGFTQGGLSLRAQSQLTKFAGKYGVPRTDLESIVLRTFSNSQAMFQWENQLVGVLRQLGNPLPENLRPRGIPFPFW